MKNNSSPSFRFVLLSAALLGTVPLHAADHVEAHWTDVCKVAGDKALTITTADGATVEGFCVSIGVDQISIRTKDQRLVNVARSALSRIDMHLHLSSTRGHELRSLGHGMRVGLSHGVGWLFSPSALMGMVAIPSTLAWGAVSAPFCAIGDLADKLSGPPASQREIRVI
jgi:hypothetical protein